MGLTRKVLAVLAVTFLAQRACVLAQSLVSTYINVTSIPSKPMFDAMQYVCTRQPGSTRKRLSHPAIPACIHPYGLSYMPRMLNHHLGTIVKRMLHAMCRIVRQRHRRTGDEPQHVCMCINRCRAAEVHFSNDSAVFYAGYAGGDNILYDNYNAEMITKRSAQMYCQTGAPSFPVVEATIAGAHAVRTHVHTVLGHAHSYMCSNSFVLTAGYVGGRA